MTSDLSTENVLKYDVILRETGPCYALVSDRSFSTAGYDVTSYDGRFVSWWVMVKKFDSLVPVTGRSFL